MPVCSSVLPHRLMGVSWKRGSTFPRSSPCETSRRIRDGMHNRIAPEIEGRFGPIFLLTETSAPTVEQVLDLIPVGPIVVCDFCPQGIEDAAARPWGYETGRLCVVDHHAPDARWERHVSSGNLAAVYREDRGTAAAVVINHTDCDSVVSAAIVAGLLEPKAAYLEAVVAADHTGSPDPIADVLQAVQDFRDLPFSLECLSQAERGAPLPVRAQNLLAHRLADREKAKGLAFGALREGRMAFIALDDKIESDLVAPFVKDAWILALTFPHTKDSARTELKLRLAPDAPMGFTLRSLDMAKVDPAFGGRWNAGSNKRGGGSRLRSSELFERLSAEVSRAVANWTLEKALRIASEAHAGQLDKSGSPYILHPLRVAAQLKGVVEKTVALLHDVVEDCPGWSFERLAKEGLSEDVLGPLRLVTKDPGVDLSEWSQYMAFVERCAAHPVAAAVKLADLQDNMDIGRIAVPTDRDRQRVYKYSIARQRLISLARGLDPEPLERPAENAEPWASLTYFFTHKIDVDARQTENGLVELNTGLPLELKVGSRFRIRAAGTSFPSLPPAFALGGAVVMPFLAKGTRCYFAIRADGVPKEFSDVTIEWKGRPVLRAEYTPDDPLSPRVLPVKAEEVYVLAVLKEDLFMMIPAGRDGKLERCKVLVPALEEEFESLNQAYSGMARVFEPWRKSVAGNVFRRAHVIMPVRTPDGTEPDHLVWLDYLRGRAEAKALGKILERDDSGEDQRA